MRNKVLSRLGEYKPHIILGPIIKLMEAMFELFVPMVMVDIIDNGINGANGSVSYILVRCGILVALAFIGFGCSVVCQWLASTCSEGYGMKLRRDMFEHIMSLSKCDIDSIGSSALVVRINGDVATIQNGVAMTIRQSTRAPFIIIGATVMAFTINVKMASIFIVVAPLLFVAMYFILAKTVPMYTKVQQKLDKAGAAISENVQGVKVIRAFGKEQEQAKSFEKVADDLQNSAIKVGKLSAILNPTTRIIINLAIVVLIYFSGGMVNVGDMTQGEVVALVNYLLQISLAMEMLVNLVLLYTRVFASYRRVKQVMDCESSMAYGDSTIAEQKENCAVVSMQNVDFAYGKSNRLFIKDYSLSINPGEFVGVIGATGSGKSTLANIITRQYDILSGEIDICGVNVKDYQKGEINKSVAVVPQRAVLFSGSVESNMTFRKSSASKEELYHALKMADAYDFVMESGGLDSIVAKGGNNYSGGQRQRLCIARALVGDSKLLVLDDATSALDFATEAKVLTNIMRDKPNTAKLVISLRVNAIKNADKIIVLDHGDIVGVGTHSELLANCPVYSEIYHTQNDSAQPMPNQAEEVAL